MWRSLLFVPVLNPRLVKSAARCYADAIVLDLEAAGRSIEKKKHERSC